jgi:hypothetical protein
LAYGKAWGFAQQYGLPYHLAPVEALPTQASFPVFILAGQSNMAGQARVTREDTQPHARVLALGPQGRWVPAREPLHRQRFQLVGTGPGLAFAKTLAEARPTLSIGVLPCAMGGSAVQHWMGDAPFRGVALYQRMLRQATQAQQHGYLAGMLWHQGESNATPHHFPAYAAQLAALFARLRADLALPELPIFVAEIGAWLPAERFPHAAMVNEVLKELAQREASVHLVPAATLPHGGDGVHLSREAAHELGRRYAAAVLQAEILPPES